MSLCAKGVKTSTFLVFVKTPLIGCSRATIDSAKTCALTLFSSMSSVRRAYKHTRESNMPRKVLLDRWCKFEDIHKAQDRTLLNVLSLSLSGGCLDPA